MKRNIVLLYTFLLIWFCAIPAMAYNDVKKTDWYWNSVTWAIERKIATANIPSTFGVNEQCTRATTLMYLYNYSGAKCSPTNDFTDVSETSKYAAAVTWGVKTGITNGTGIKKFSPNTICSRAQVVTFLWRMAGCPKATVYQTFSDVRSNDYFYEPVSWAISLGITNGTGIRTFSPHSTCTKAQILTFLYRYAMATEKDPPISTTTSYSSTIVSCSTAKFDVGGAAAGFIRVQWNSDMNKKIKLQITGPTTTYTYDIKTANKWFQFPLSDGNGEYKIGIYRNTTGNKYSTIYTHSLKVKLNNEFGPFLYPNQYVNYEEAPKAVTKAQELCKNKTALEKINAVYYYTIHNLSYDYDLAKSVESGYLPDLDKVFQKGKGICFDYGALVAGMLRSQGVPCKLVIGYAGDQYHAWISAYTDESGWIEGVIYFNGKTWERMDPTFASTGNSSNKILQYINNDKNYTAKYFY